MSYTNILLTFPDDLFLAAGCSYHHQQAFTHTTLCLPLRVNTQLLCTDRSLTRFSLRCHHYYHYYLGLHPRCPSPRHVQHSKQSNSELVTELGGKYRAESPTTERWPPRILRFYYNILGGHWPLRGDTGARSTCQNQQEYKSI